MIIISREIELGLLLMLEMSKSSDQKSLQLQSWAQKKGLPYRSLSKVAVKLKKAFLLESKEGRGGGYWLAKKPAEINIKEIVAALEGKITGVRCLRGEKCGWEQVCGHRKLMKRLSEAVERQLTKVSLGDLCS